ncbi:MAG: glycosyltransferase family 9 protein [Methylophilales bacterium]|nr:glycosyltransferase family 9 protein [Methylophilales bacterium]|tara:strand:+ start:1037 stop:2056 length:1020 start_codon:yes stop_codon:yes gene_type:complete
MKNKKILVYTNGELLGDGLYKLDFIKNLKSNFPRSKIFWLCAGKKTVYSSILSPLVKDLIYEVIDLNKTNISLINFIFNSHLRNNKYDIVIDTQSSILKTLLIKTINHDVFLSATANWLFSKISPKKNSEKKVRLIDKLNFFVDLVSSYFNKSIIGIQPYQIKITTEYSILSKKLLPLSDKYVGISPGAGDQRKIWPLDNFIKVARGLVEKNFIPVFFIGPGEQHLAEQLRKEVPSALFPELEKSAIKSRLAGPILAIALANRLELSIANDSGAGHIFSKSTAPLILLFSKHDPIKYAPNSCRLTIIDSKAFGGPQPELIPYDFVMNKVYLALKLGKFK